LLISRLDEAIFAEDQSQKFCREQKLFPLLAQKLIFNQIEVIAAL
jgi:hypothetical protein